MTQPKQILLLDETKIDRTITRISHEIVERFPELENIAIIGIRTRGEFIARRIAEIVKSITGNEIPIGFVNVTFHRDDFRERLIQPQVKGTDIPFSIDGLAIILADDVLYTGRTIRAALSEIINFGRPSAVTLAVLVDRGHREMPIKADFVGKNIPTGDAQHVYVRMKEVDGIDGVYLVTYNEE